MYRDSSNFGGTGIAQSPSKVPLKGLFKDGTWLCNCRPRLPAQRFQAKRQNANYGRWFYTCQNKSCNFFLWEEEAKSREQGALMGNSRSETHPDNTSRRVSRGISAMGGVDAPVGFGSTQTTPSKPPRSPSQQIADEFYGDWSDAEVDTGSNEDFYDWPLSDEETAEHSRRTENNAPPISSSIYPTLRKQTYDTASMPPPPQTPRKAARTGIATSPRKRSRSPSPPLPARSPQAGLQTPTTNTISRYFNASSDQPDPFKTPQTVTPRKNLFTNYTPTGTTPTTSAPMITPLTTPSPLRFQDPTVTTPGGGATTATGTSSDLKDEVLALLAKHDVQLPDAAQEELVSLLNKHTLRSQGIAKGRDISRLALKAKDTQLKGLQEKLGEMEARREVDRAEVRMLREGNKQR